MKKYNTYTFNMLIMNILAIFVFAALFGILILFNYDMIIEFKMSHLVICILWFLLHEVLHGIGFAIFKCDRSKIILGMELEKGILYCMNKQRISRIHILVSLLIPLFGIGILTLIIGLIIQSTGLILLSIVNISGAVGDMVMTLAILRMPKDIEYLDTDLTTGFHIISKKDINNKKYFGLKLVETGEYDEKKLIAKDYQKIKISKTSWVFMIIIVVFLVLEIIFNI